MTAEDLQRSFYSAAYARPGVASPKPSMLQRLELHRTEAALALVRPGGQLLDLGCGDGRLLVKAASRFLNVVGVDLADPQIQATRRNLATAGVANASVVMANVDRGLPLLDRQFDVVTAIAVLALVLDPIAQLHEIRRVLRPGGQLVVEVLNLVYLPRRLAVLTGRLPTHTTCHGWEGGHLHNFTRPALIRLLRECGFEVEAVTGSGVLTSLRQWWPGLLLGNVIASARRVDG